MQTRPVQTNMAASASSVADMTSVKLPCLAAQLASQPGGGFRLQQPVVEPALQRASPCLHDGDLRL